MPASDPGKRKLEGLGGISKVGNRSNLGRSKREKKRFKVRAKKRERKENFWKPW